MTLIETKVHKECPKKKGRTVTVGRGPPRIGGPALPRHHIPHEVPCEWCNILWLKEQVMALTEGE